MSSKNIKPFVAPAMLLAFLFAASVVSAHGKVEGSIEDEGGGYITTLGNLVIKNGNGGCLRSGSFNDDNQTGACEGKAEPVAAAPSVEPVPQPVVQESPEPMMLKTSMKSTLTSGFDPGSAELTPSGEADLNALISRIAATPGVTSIKVAGHSDSQGGEKGNMELSKKRAAVVGNRFVQAFPNAKVTAVAFGETRPIASNDTEEGRAQNRRVEVNAEGLAPSG